MIDARQGIQRAETLARQGKLLEARQVLVQASRRAPAPAIFARLAEICVEAGLPTEAIAWSRAVPVGAPEEARALVALIAAHQRTGADADDEEGALARLAAISPESPHLPLLAGVHLQQNGRFADAELEFRRSLELSPKQGGAYWNIVSGRRLMAADEPLIEEMERLAAENVLGAGESGLLYFALGKGYEDLGQYGMAMDRFLEANRRMRERILGGRAFDRAAMARDIDRTIALFSHDRLQAEPPRELPVQPVPILISGAMRSGTTLLEQIMCAHPEVAPGGEQPFWRSVAWECVDLAGPSLRRNVIEAKAAEYVRLLRDIAPGARYVTDKNPANLPLFGLLFVALPNSPLILMRRNLADVALSIFTTYFQTGERYVWDRDDIAFALKQHVRLTEHLRQVLPERRFREVLYEELVTNPQPTLRELLAFCGLHWSDACLRPETRERRVQTPSLWQVRQPVNPGSVGRWRRYEGCLGPFKELVDPA